MIQLEEDPVESGHKFLHLFHDFGFFAAKFLKGRGLELIDVRGDGGGAAFEAGIFDGQIDLLLGPISFPSDPRDLLDEPAAP